MDTSPRIVLAETDPARFLRFVLEGEGLPVIGLASNDEDLRRVLCGVRPAVVVVDAGIAAATALEVRESHPDTSLIVVWPPGIAALLAHEHVEPDRVVEDLGDAVRRGLAGFDRREAEHRRALEQVGIPPHIRRLLGPHDEVEAPAPTPAASRPTPVARARHAVALTAAVWVLSLAVATAMAATAPSAIRFLREIASPAQERPPVVTVTSSPSARMSVATGDERDAPGGTHGGRGEPRTGDDPRCEVSTHRPQDRDRPEGRGCSEGHRQDGANATPHGHDPDGGGRPEDTGKPEEAGKPQETGKPEGTPVREPAGDGRSAGRPERPRR